jgi:phenol 2-monooxygenase
MRHHRQRSNDLSQQSDHHERQATAQELIDFDHHWSRLLGAKNVTGDEMDAAWKKSMKFTSGTGVVYKPNILVEQDVTLAARLASEITIGSVCPR